MSDISVTGNKLTFMGKTYHCSSGKSGFTKNKAEGDNMTPLGKFALRQVLYRADRIQPPQCVLPTSIIAENDGWCDAPEDANYNRQVKLPYAARHEKLWREDDVYNLIVPLGYNDAPVMAGKGSAIFLHLARDNYADTEGCIALKLPDLTEVLRQVEVSTKIIIQP